MPSRLHRKKSGAARRTGTSAVRGRSRPSSKPVAKVTRIHVGASAALERLVGILAKAAANDNVARPLNSKLDEER